MDYFFARRVSHVCIDPDILVGNLFRNFLLAERIMKDYQCTPHTYPPLPPTKTHPLWAAWDLAVESCLMQLPDLIGAHPNRPFAPQSNQMVQNAQEKATANIMGAADQKPYIYVPNQFFTDQLTAFEVWISRGRPAPTKRGLSLLQDEGDRFAESQIGRDLNDKANDLISRPCPDQLPIILHALLSQAHRLRALILLSQFVDLGPWAVRHVLSAGIVAYVLKLLQIAGQDLRPVLIFIWARILAVDSSVQNDLYPPPRLQILRGGSCCPRTSK